MIYPVILCGGSGTRLWPVSRAERPKPFLQLVGPDSLFEQTIARCSDKSLFAAPTVVTGQKHLDLVKKQLKSATRAQVIVEPQGKNTAPAIALAAMRLPEDAVMLVCPSDHFIDDRAAFIQAVSAASSLAQDDWLVTFGITAVRPETGFGYIQQGQKTGKGYAVGKFVEKPDADTAKKFLADGGYSWNGGIFCFKAGCFLQELAKHRPQMFDLLRDAVAAGRTEGVCFFPDAAKFAAIEGDSIDYAVMENTRRAAMVPAAMGWSDIGNWEALRNARTADHRGNTVRGQADLIDCSNVLVQSDGPRVSAIGLDQVIIVVDGDEVLVTTTAGAQLVGKLKGASSQ